MTHGQNKMQVKHWWNYWSRPYMGLPQSEAHVRCSTISYDGLPAFSWKHTGIFWWV